MFGLIPMVCFITVIAGLFGLPALPFFVGGTLLTCFVAYRMTHSLMPARLGLASLLVVAGRFFIVSLFPAGETPAAIPFASVVLSPWPSWIVTGLALLVAGLIGIYGHAEPARKFRGREVSDG